MPTQEHGQFHVGDRVNVNVRGEGTLTGVVTTDCPKQDGCLVQIDDDDRSPGGFSYSEMTLIPRAPSRTHWERLNDSFQFDSGGPCGKTYSTVHSIPAVRM